MVVELYAGQDAKKKKAQEAIDATLKNIEFTDLNFVSAQRAGEIIRTCPQIPGLVDPIIAAIAMEQNAQVATHNIKHFQQIRGVTLYKFLT